MGTRLSSFFLLPDSLLRPSYTFNLLFLFFFSLAILSRVLLYKLLSDRDNQINRLKRSDKVNRTTDLVRSISLSLSLFTSVSSGEKNKFAWATCFGPISPRSWSFLVERRGDSVFSSVFAPRFGPVFQTAENLTSLCKLLRDLYKEVSLCRDSDN